MTELLILLILQENNCTIYKIRQDILSKYSIFFSVSLGSIYPALKKLEKKKYVNIRKKISQGGQRSSLYSITDEGKKYLNSLMIQDFPDNPCTANQLITIKLMSLSKFDAEIKEIIKRKILKYLQNQIDLAKNVVNRVNNAEHELENKYIDYNIQKNFDLIKWIENTI